MVSKDFMNKVIQLLKKHDILYIIFAIAIMATVALLYFFPDDIQGNVLQQPDTRQGLAVGHEAKMFEETTGETTHWTNSLFGGMPMFQISPSYSSTQLFSWFTNFLSLGLPSPANL